MNEKCLKLINEILDLPIISDMAGIEFNIKCNTNGKGPVWEVNHIFTSPMVEKTIKMSTEYLEKNTDLEDILEGLLNQLKNNS